MTPTPNRFYQTSDLDRREELESGKDYRTPFQMDRDRILYTQSFRRLQAKTQVFQTGAYDFYRTRLTHSLEVAQIARSLCHYLGNHTSELGPDFHPDPDLVEGISLAHDIGHPPFGHAGERVLNELMRRYGGFEGNAQSLRLITGQLFENPQRLRGINPSRALLDGILKYKQLWSERRREQKGETPENHFLYDDQAEWRDFAHAPYPEALAPENLPCSIECQLMDWADDTAYSLNDLSDGLCSGLLSTTRVQRWLDGNRDRFDIPDRVVDKLLKGLDKGSLDSFCGFKIGEFIRGARMTPSQHPWGEHSHRYAWKLEVSPAIRSECKFYKVLALELIFRSEPLQQMEVKAQRMLKELFDTLMDNYSSPSPLHLLPPLRETRIKEADGEEAMRAREITDTLASLTDGQALRLYRRMFAPEADNLLDLLA